MYINYINKEYGMARRILCPKNMGWLELENAEHCQDYGERLSPFILYYRIQLNMNVLHTRRDNFNDPV